jgi:hypothetical protein
MPPGTYGGQQQQPQIQGIYGDVGLPIANEGAYGGVYGESNVDGVYGEGDTVSAVDVAFAFENFPISLPLMLSGYANPQQISVGSMPHMSKMSTMSSMAGYP